MHFIINYILGIDIFQIISIIIVHYVFFITPLVGRAEKIVVKIGDEKPVAVPSVNTAIKNDVKQKPKESKKKR